jgi:hypothetical protein
VLRHLKDSQAGLCHSVRVSRESALRLVRVDRCNEMRNREGDTVKGTCNGIVPQVVQQTGCSSKR